VDTIKVKHANTDTAYALINVSDFDSKCHTAYSQEDADAAKAWADSHPAVEADEALRLYAANRGVTPSPSYDFDRNSDGTFSEPTPTDVRYPDKDETEYANNHGAFMGKSAAQMRKALDLPDMPGGLRPDKHAVKTKRRAEDKMFEKEMEPADINATPDEKAEAAKAGLDDAMGDKAPMDAANAMADRDAKAKADKAKADADKAKADADKGAK
jgi:hypothetical protein